MECPGAPGCVWGRIMETKRRARTRLGVRHENMTRNIPVTYLSTCVCVVFCGEKAWQNERPLLHVAYGDDGGVSCCDIIVRYRISFLDVSGCQLSAGMKV